MKKLLMLALVSVLLLSGCLQNSTEEEVLQNDNANEETSIVPSYKLSEENYRMILPYKTSKARGVITNQMGSNRVDIDEMEEGLRRLSKEVYNPEEMYFEEGQHLTSDMIYEWIGELNPTVETGSDEETFRENPRYLTHILEQNYLRPSDDEPVELAGISLGIAMKSVYRFQTDAGEPFMYQDIPMNEMLGQAYEIAETIVQDIRRDIPDLADIPIMIAIYRENEQSSPVPGSFVAKANVAGGSSSIGEWESINEEYVLFPSREGQEKYYDDHEIVNSFGNKISDFFPNYVGVIGKGFYIDEELQKLTIEIPIEFYGKAEVTGFTQYAYGLVMDMFQNHYDLEINITSSNNGNKVESLIYREAGEETPTVHIYH